ncbi:MAG: hypothetical protein R3B98_10255 [Hyphomonas sp.]
MSFRLFALTLASILFVEALIFVPSASGFRNAWLQERLQAARIAVLALDAAPSRMVSEELAQTAAAQCRSAERVGNRGRDALPAARLENAH